ncbi:hypothetical protein SAMN04515668_3178 [Hymenobacter arizonensis]|uniref:Uncharacterized protein n=1 Tax=Hymenobacter arizonensis TaxID=1227077 RepID=A0A1I5ZT58_HYMAR|nr:hypothetical protein SAMN04515668_3178 [Hymenobacter arizonensis]
MPVDEGQFMKFLNKKTVMTSILRIKQRPRHCARFACLASVTLSLRSNFSRFNN